MMTLSKHIGRPPSQLIDTDIIVTGDAPGITGTVVFLGGIPHVQWEDFAEPRSLAACPIVVTMRRPGEVLSWEQ
jgi:hypothetical protein